VIQTVREKFSCRDCETIAQPPAPFHVTPRGFAGPNLLAMILFEKFGQHQPLNRQSERYAREGVDLSLSKLADQVGACTAVLQPLHALIEHHVLAAGRLHGDDHHRADPGQGQDHQGAHLDLCPRRPAVWRARSAGGALLRLARSPRGASGPASWRLQGYPAGGRLWRLQRVVPAIARARTHHARPVLGARQAAVLRADRYRGDARRGRQAAAISPIALEAVKRIDALFDIERGINGQSAEERLRVRQERSAPLLVALEAWLREQRARLSNASAVAGPIDYMLRRFDRFARFIDDGRICLANNAAERALRGFALGRKSWLFAGSERGADRAAVMATLIMTAKLNGIDPQAWLADVLARIAAHPSHRLDELLPWNWSSPLSANAAQAA
jgi:hypothetical protein